MDTASVGYIHEFTLGNESKVRQMPAQAMRLNVLGCSGGIGAGLRTTSFLVDDEILIDAGTGVGDLSLTAMGNIKHVFVTHSHLDHIASIPKIVDTLFSDLCEPLPIYAQPDTIRALQSHIFNWTIWPDFAVLPCKEHPVMKYVPMKPGQPVTIGSKTLEMIRVNHVVPGVAYYVSTESGSFCFSGDTTTNDNLWQRLNEKDRLDVLLVECGFANRDRELAGLAKHYCPELLAADLRKLKHRPKVGISHLKPGEEDLIFEECKAAVDGLELFRVRGGDTLEVISRR
jgi:ribonuclease BN (tRNA processing enzyme)